MAVRRQANRVVAFARSVPTRWPVRVGQPLSPVRHPLTSTGVGVAIGSIGALIIGLVLEYREFLLLAAAGAALLLAASAIPRVASTAQVGRRISQRMVQRGSEVSMTLDVATTGFLTPTRMVDAIGTQEIVVDVPGVIASRPVRLAYVVQPIRRGVHQVGPIKEERRDPFSLAFRSLVHDVVDELWVHPVIHPLLLTSRGIEDHLHRTPVRALTDDPLAEFRALRPYEPGDDPRRVHWPSSAKMGSLLVREHVEFRRRERMIMLDTLESSASDDEFETCVEVAASLAIAALDQRVQMVAITRDQQAQGSLRPVREHLDVLKLFTRVRRTAPEETVSLSRVARIFSPNAQVIVVGGGGSPMIKAFCGERYRRSSVSVVRVSAGAARLTKLPVPTLDVATAEEFAARWGRGVLR